jgi:hypothetical protein
LPTSVFEQPRVSSQTQGREDEEDDVSSTTVVLSIASTMTFLLLVFAYASDIERFIFGFFAGH